MRDSGSAASNVHRDPGSVGVPLLLSCTAERTAGVNEKLTAGKACHIRKAAGSVDKA